MSTKTTKWRKNEFQYLQEMMYRKQIKEKIDLYNRYSDVLDFKDKNELKRLRKIQKSFLIIGKTSQSK
ncbi:hypothetical protein B5E92_13930 [Erysipelatoclostridium sp. An15]|uniref:hypothetical protein n=1 Tax=Erysipelatoclostridium sp. An15 TaxID=1965566 RepID=UPI000B384D4F|nr:hypothetical protein [Erysipelatoclostridium sp. An15]OUQ03213.1 hypothetical protein B5E92_13930 [Erysipelatoclostridium sp. An15]